MSVTTMQGLATTKKKQHLYFLLPQRTSCDSEISRKILPDKLSVEDTNMGSIFTSLFYGSIGGTTPAPMQDKHHTTNFILLGPEQQL
jgi:hypothetical protein